MMNPTGKPKEAHLRFLIQTHWTRSNVEKDYETLKNYVDKTYVL